MTCPECASTDIDTQTAEVRVTGNKMPLRIYANHICRTCEHRWYQTQYLGNPYT
jgi:RNase P subunit RPR2